MWTCAYRNESNRMVILRCLGAPNYFHEKVIFPFETWMFECPPESEVEIWTHELGGPDLKTRLPAAQLRVTFDTDSLAEPVALGFAGLVMAPELDLLPPSLRQSSNSLVSHRANPVGQR